MKRFVMGFLVGLVVIGATVGATHYFGDRSVAAAEPNGN